jgi:hypothetical protein
MKPASQTNSIENERIFRLLSYALVFLLMGCTILVLNILIVSVFPRWHFAMIAGVALFVVIDRLYTFRQTKKLALLSTEWMVAFGSQWIVILLVVRLLLSYSNGIDSLRNDLSLFASGYLEKFFTPEYIASILLAFGVWTLTRKFLDLIDEIGLDQRTALGEEIVMPDNPIPAHQRMVSLVLTLGIVLVILTALSRMNLEDLVSATGKIPKVQFSRFSGAEAGALLYFVFGLGLLSLSRLMSLHTHWNRQRIPISSRNLARQWGVYSALFLLMLGLVVGILPAGDSIGFFSLVIMTFSFLLRVIWFVSQLVIGLILLLLSLPFLLFNKTPAEVVKSPPPALPPLLPTGPELPAVNNELLALIRSIFLWGALIVVVLFALIQFFRQRGDIVPAIRRSRITNWLLLAWQWLYRNVKKTGNDLSRLVAAGWQGMTTRLEGKRILPPMGLIRLRSLDPRRQIYFYYLAMIRRGTENGIPRQPSQTPSEYAGLLEKELPSATEDISAITDAFVEARYSRRDIDTGKAEFVKDLWGRIRHALQTKSKGRNSSEK